jgi:hypothetical protein
MVFVPARDGVVAAASEQRVAAPSPTRRRNPASERPPPRDRVLWIALLTTAPTLLVVAMTLYAQLFGQRGGFGRGDTLLPEVARRILAGGFVGAACIALPKPTAFSLDRHVRTVAKGAALLIALGAWLALSRPAPREAANLLALETTGLAALLFVVVHASRARVDPAATTARDAEDPAAFPAWRKRVVRNFFLLFLLLGGLAALAFHPALLSWLGATTFALPMPVSDRNEMPISVYEVAAGLFGLAATLQSELVAPKGWRFARSHVTSASERRAWLKNHLVIAAAFLFALVLLSWTEAILSARAAVVRERVQPLAAALLAADRSGAVPRVKRLDELGLASLPAGSPIDPLPQPVYCDEFDRNRQKGDLGGFSYRIATWNGPPARREAWLTYELPDVALRFTFDDYRIDPATGPIGNARVVRREELASDADGTWTRFTLERD